MRKGKDYTLVGVDIHPREVRIARVDYKGGRPTLVGTATGNLSSYAFQGSQLSDAGGIATVLRSLLDQVRASGDAGLAFNAPTSLCRVRRLSVPVVPANELPLIVAGEVAHFNLHAPGGASDFITLDTKGLTDASVQSTAVLVAAVDEPLLHGVRQIAGTLNADVECLEPEAFAIIRSTLAGSKPGNETVGIAIAESTTELFYVHSGAIRFYRSIEVGARHLLSDYDDLPASGLPEENALPLANGAEMGLNTRAFEDLSLEIRRSIEFLIRSYNDLSGLNLVVSTVSEPRLAGVSELLAQRITLPVELVRPSNFTLVAGLAEEMGQDEALKYSAAIGAALRNAQGPASFAPKVDLFTHLRRAEEVSETKRNLGGSIAVAGAALALGVAGYWLFSNQIREIEGRLATASTRLATLETEVADLETRTVAQTQQYNQLLGEGVPVAPVTDAIAESLANGVGLTDLRIDFNKGIFMNGEATSEAAMLQTVRQMQSQPLLNNVGITSFDKVPNGNGALRFSLSGTTLGMSQVNMGGGVR